MRSKSGSIQVIKDHLSGQVTLDNNGADTMFQGTLDPAGDNHFTSNGGPIILTLPQNTAIHLNAATNNGSPAGSLILAIPLVLYGEYSWGASH